MSVMGNTQLSLSEEQAMLLDVAREFCRDQSPISEVRAQLGSDSGYNADTWRQMVELGWSGIALPESCGGAGLGVGAVVPVLEAMGRGMLATPLINTTLAGQLLLRASDGVGTESLLAEIAGGAVATVAWLENEDWGDEQLRCSVDNGVLSGTKYCVGDAAAAELLLVPVAGPALAVLRTSQLPEGALRAHTLIDETRRAASVKLDGAPVELLLQGEQVANALREVRLLGALLVAAEATGSAAACLDTVVEYLQTRKQFGKLIGSYQALKHPAVDMLTGMDSARSFVYHAATLVAEGPLGADAEIACRMAKVQAAEALLFAGDRAVQFHGGMGFTYECDAQLYIRRAQWSQQQFGDARQHRRALAALLLD